MVVKIATWDLLKKMQFGFYEMIRPKVDLWRSFEGQQGARLTEKEKKTDFTANSAGEFSASFFFFFISVANYIFFLLLFPMISLPWNISDVSIT